MSTETDNAQHRSLERLVRAHLPARLRSALEAVVGNEGDDLYFVLGYVAKSTARSYMSQLKARGLAYTHVSGGTVEAWAHDKGRRLVRPNGKLRDYPFDIRL